jgi:ligand-binding SRPBCC domain-containing protein
MITLWEITLIRAPIERCFDLSRSIDLHTESTARTGERAIAGVTSGLIGMGEEVTWRARHLGVWQELTSRITAFDPPRYFQDTMVRGAFRWFQHDHSFRKQSDGSTEMEDVLQFSAPPPILGRVAEAFLAPYLRKFLKERNRLLKCIAESTGWKKYLPHE